jgi:hypothetical protein
MTLIAWLTGWITPARSMLWNHFFPSDAVNNRTNETTSDRERVIGGLTTLKMRSPNLTHPISFFKRVLRVMDLFICRFLLNFIAEQ